MSVPFATRVFPFRPDLGKCTAWLVWRCNGVPRGGGGGEPVLEDSRWDPVSRVEVYAFPGEFGLVNGVAPVLTFVQGRWRGLDAAQPP